MGFIKKELVGNEDNFWNAIKIYCRLPNSINKEVLYSELICYAQIELPLSRMDCQNLCDKLYNYLFCEMKDIKDVMNILKDEEQMKLLDGCDDFNGLDGNYFIMRKLIPKKTGYSKEDFYEVCFIDTRIYMVKLYSLFRKNNLNNCAVNGVYREYDPFVIVKFNNIRIHYENNYLNIEYDDNLSEKGINWINSVFVTKMLKLISSASKNQSITKLCFSSQVDVVNYYELYERLKKKYAKQLVENWSENTDPQKFVYEDIGIATYLLLLWNGRALPDEYSQKQKFVDLGCGNGLLVYILNSEGHDGVGLDLRKRKIWESYPPNVILKEEAIVPGPSSTYPNADWLIGNHSDELTPWLPVMARRSGPNCQYFVLPCCPYQLNGKTYQRKNSRLSVYHDFIQYVQEISEMCEFETFIDKLRIPSTKRICVIGRKKELTLEEVDCIQKKIDNYIVNESQCDVTNRNNNIGDTDKWIPEFKVRETVERVRNCTKLPKTLISEIVLTIANHLLKEKCVIKIDKENGVSEWNQGGTVPISEVASALTQKQLKHLKKECKGLQTLIRNHHYVFHVSGGAVRFRNNQEMLNISQRVLKDREMLKWKEKDCWFHVYHPDGCPLEDSKCSYKHSTMDISKINGPILQRIIKPSA